VLCDTACSLRCLYDTVLLARRVRRLFVAVLYVVLLDRWSVG